VLEVLLVLCLFICETLGSTCAAGLGAVNGATRRRAAGFILTNDDLVDSLKQKGILKTPRIEKVLRQVDRAKYTRNTEDAYIDSPQTIGHLQTISAPHMHCAALEYLKDHVHEGARVLDVGSGSGYLTTCFGILVGSSGKAVGLERIPELVQWAQENIKNNRPEFLSDGRVEIVQGDGWAGYPKYAPYDAIHVGAAAEHLPQKLVDQLKKGGRMIIPVGTDWQELIQVDKDESGKISQKSLLGVIYVPLVKPK